MRKIELQARDFSFSMRPGLSLERRSSIARIVIGAISDPPCAPAEARAAAIRECLAQYTGSPSRRAKTLERAFAGYLSGGWLREQHLDRPPEPHSTERFCLHRLAKCTNGRPLCWRRILDIAAA